LSLGFPYSNVRLANIRYQTSEISDAPEQAIRKQFTEQQIMNKNGFFSYRGRATMP
jgi:hypothetical protein